MFRELTSLIAEEDDKINAVHKELSSVHEQLDQERTTITIKEEELHQQEVTLVAVVH